MMEGKKHVDYLDIVKGIGIILVVWAHARGTFNSYIYQFHMPLFFLVSGYLYSDRKNIREFILSKIKTLYLPFVICNLLGTIIKVHTGLLNIRGFDLYIKIIFTLEKDGQFFGATWFLGALFAVSVLYRIIDYVLSDYKNRYIIMMLFFAMVALCGFERTFNYMLSRTMILSFFFSAGHLIKTAHFPPMETRKKWIGAILSFAMFVFLARYNSVGMGTNKYAYPMSFLLESFLASYVVVVVSQFIDTAHVLRPLKKVLVYLGQNSVDIVIWQFVAFRAVIALQLYICKEPLSSILKYYPCYDASGIWMYVYTVVGIIGSILVGQILRRGIKGILSFFG